MYKIVRSYFNRPGYGRTIKSGLSLEQAQEHCNNSETSSSTATCSAAKATTRRHGIWFDSYIET